MCPLIKFFSASFYKAAVQHQSARSLYTAGRAETWRSSERLGQRHCPTGSVFSRLQPSGAGRAGVGIFFPEFPLSVYCCFQSDTQMSARHSESSIVSPSQDSSTYPKMLQAKFPAVSPLRLVRTARGALASLRLHLQGAGNASLSPCPLKTWAGSLAKRGGETPANLVAASRRLQSVPRGKRLFSVC